MLVWSRGFTAKESHGRGNQAPVILSPQVCSRYGRRLWTGNPTGGQEIVQVAAAFKQLNAQTHNSKTQ